jgi:hypothetical protein
MDKKVSFNEISNIIGMKSHAMNQYLNQDDIDPFKRERLQEQLSWLRHQMNQCAQDADPFALVDRFHWVVDNFNLYLNLPDEEKFEYFQAD